MPIRAFRGNQRKSICQIITRSFTTNLGNQYSVPIDQSNKSHNAPNTCSTIRHSEWNLEWKCAHGCPEWCIVGHGRGTMLDLWIWSIDLSSWWTHLPLIMLLIIMVMMARPANMQSMAHVTVNNIVSLLHDFNQHVALYRFIMFKCWYCTNKDIKMNVKLGHM